MKNKYDIGDKVVVNDSKLLWHNGEVGIIKFIYKVETHYKVTLRYGSLKLSEDQFILAEEPKDEDVTNVWKPYKEIHNRLMSEIKPEIKGFYSEIDNTYHKVEEVVSKEAKRNRRLLLCK
jgi:hypothetical protein